MMRGDDADERFFFALFYGPAPDAAPAEPLPAEPAAFWTAVSAHDLPSVAVLPASADAVVPQYLGPLPQWSADASLFESLAPVYRLATARVLSLLGED